MHKRLVPYFLVAGLALLSAHVPHAWGGGDPLGSAITSQGRLMQNGEPASGEVDLVFRLDDSATGSNQIGPTLSAPDFAVEEGLFTIDLDLGPVFGQNGRWLDRPARGRRHVRRLPRK